MLWCVCDQIVKAYTEAHTPSSALVGVIDGVVGFRLVHNFGAAWGSFSGMVIVLVIVSIVLCAIILAYMIYVAKEALGVGNSGSCAHLRRRLGKHDR